MKKLYAVLLTACLAFAFADEMPVGSPQWQMSQRIFSDISATQIDCPEIPTERQAMCVATGFTGDQFTFYFDLAAADESLTPLTTWQYLEEDEVYMRSYEFGDDTFVAVYLEGQVSETSSKAMAFVFIIPSEELEQP